ncbi:CPBP family intramembrane glutamic endopeptidase [Ekhidna sp.]|uniref:CPBP family intramembrane glutamic endopeptidase n=1 Tax=Ekhidna sp. TaxID=2608089 RepID=UPI003C7AC957
MYLNHLSQLLTRHKLGVVFAAILTVVLLVLGNYYETLPKTLTYLLTIGGCFLISEFFFYSGKMNLDKRRIDHAKTELLVIVVCQVIVVFMLFYWFVLSDPQDLGKPVKIAVMIVRLLFAFPVFFLIYFVGIKRYTFRQLGFHFRYWYIALPLIVLIGGVSYLVFPDGLQFQDVLKENGYLAFVTLGFITAAIPEEFTRNLLQTRLAKVLNSQSIGWIIASLFWALTHIPSFGSQNGDFAGAAASALGILPIGLLWGYLNERYKSIIPSILIHGTNLWGLQNIF